MNWWRSPRPIIYFSTNISISLCNYYFYYHQYIEWNGWSAPLKWCLWRLLAFHRAWGEVGSFFLSVYRLEAHSMLEVHVLNHQLKYFKLVKCFWNLEQPSVCSTYPPGHRWDEYRISCRRNDRKSPPHHAYETRWVSLDPVACVAVVVLTVRGTLAIPDSNQEMEFMLVIQF